MLGLHTHTHTHVLKYSALNSLAKILIFFFLFYVNNNFTAVFEKVAGFLC